MTAQHALKWIVMLLISASWTLASNGPTRAQKKDPVDSRPRETTVGGPVLRTEPAFDPSITVPELFEKARQAFGLNNFELATEFYQEILIRDRANVQAMLELANVYERNGKLEYARGLLVRSAKILPDDPSVAERLASVEHMLTIVLSAEVDSLLAAQEYELAIPKLSVHLSIEPDNPELLYKKAICYAHLGRPDAAISSINKAIQIDPKERYYKLREDLIDDLKAKEASEKIEKAKLLTQSDSDADRQGGLDLVAEILQEDPDNAWARAEFVRLSDEGMAPSDTTEIARVRNLTNTASKFILKIGRGATDILRRHLSAILVFIVALLVFRSPLTKLIAKWLTPQSFLSGRFPRFTLTEILVMLNSESHTGILQVKGEGCRGKIYIENGEPCHCIVGRLQGAKALHYLMDSTGAGNFEFVDGSIPLHRTIDTPLSVMLVDHSSGGPGRAARKRAASEAAAKKPKSKMKELLESRSDK